MKEAPERAVILKPFNSILSVNCVIAVFSGWHFGCGKRTEPLRISESPVPKSKSPNKVLRLVPPYIARELLRCTIHTIQCLHVPASCLKDLLPEWKWTTTITLSM